MDKGLDRNEIENNELRKMRKGWREGLEALFEMLLRKKDYSVTTAKKNIERVIALYIKEEGRLTVPLKRSDLMRQYSATLDEYPNHLPASFIQFVGDLKIKYGVEGSDEFADLLVDEPDSYYSRVFKYYFWRVALGRNKRNEFVDPRQVRFVEVSDSAYYSYINRIELFEHNEKPEVISTEDSVAKIEEPKEFVMLSQEQIEAIRSFIENDLINILEYKTARKYFDFIANLFSQDNENPYRLSISSTLIGNIRSFAFPRDILPYGLHERIAPLNLNSIQLKAFMFIFWMFVKRAPENLYKVYSESSNWDQKHDVVPVMTKYSPDILDYSTIHWLRRLEEES